MKAIAVDFDGVIHAYSKGWHDGSIYDEPVPGALAALRELMKKYAVFIFTTRNPEKVLEWMHAKFEIPCTCQANPEMEFWNVQGEILITNQKLPAIAYIDDRAIRFINWDQALHSLSRVV